ncbi:MAG: hypothetical protein ACLSFZ_13240 [Frisingicoccus sp.]
MQSFKLYQLLTGGDMSKSAKFIVREELTAAEGGTVTLTDTPASGAAVNVFAADDDCGTAKTATVANKTVTITGAAAGDKVIVYYVKDITDKVQKISVKGSSFPKAFTVYGDTVMKTESDELLPCLSFTKLPQSNMSISMSNNGEPAAITITCDLMVNDDNEMLDLILEEE